MPKKTDAIELPKADRRHGMIRREPFESPA
jgi:hypothetical protein